MNLSSRHKKNIHFAWSAALATALLLSTAHVRGELTFPNPSLDEDVNNIGCPDGWSVPASAQVSLVTDKVSHGAKAARFDSGYVLLSHDFQAAELPGLKLNITFDAAGAEGAELGVIIGISRQKPDGSVTFENTSVIWNRKLDSDYHPITITYALPTNAVRNRIYFGVYRSNKQGVVWLDNFSITTGLAVDMTAADRFSMTELKRDWGYSVSRIDQALTRKPGSSALLVAKKRAAVILARLDQDDVTLLAEDFKPELAASRLLVNRSLSDAGDLFVSLSDDCVRLEPDAIIPEKRVDTSSLLTLANEYQAFGLLTVSLTDQTQTVPISISGGEDQLERVEVRRQVFMMNWYEKAKQLQTDPLTKLLGEGRAWTLPLEPGETVKLFVSVKVKKDVSGEFPLTIRVGASMVTLNVNVLPVNLPEEPFFANFQCIYPSQGAAGRHPDLAAKDLAEHYTTGIEFPFLPSVTFNPDGTLATEDFAGSQQARWMQAYSRENIKMAIFWQGGYKRFALADETNNLPYLDETTGKLTPVWKNAYTNLLTAWLDFAEKKGVARDCFQVWCMDELASHEEYANAPGPKVLNGMEVYQLARLAAPDVPTLVTGGNYSLPADVEAFIPHVDIVLPHWPMPTELSRWAPPAFKAREAFLNESLPLMKAERERRGLTIWSYKVDGGKAESVLRTRVYPVCAVGLGFTGVGSWAYNCSQGGTTWDDTDGGLLDYIFVYDGEEAHPLNSQYNVTGEIVVPSIRWEAMRLGIQDAKILLYLKDKMERGKCDAATAAEIQSILAQAEANGRAVEFTQAWIDALSIRLRELMGRLTVGTK